MSCALRRSWRPVVYPTRRGYQLSVPAQRPRVGELHYSRKLHAQKKRHFRLRIREGRQGDVSVFLGELECVWWRRRRVCRVQNAHAQYSGHEPWTDDMWFQLDTRVHGLLGIRFPKGSAFQIRLFRLGTRNQRTSKCEFRRSWIFHGSTKLQRYSARAYPRLLHIPPK